MWGRLNKQLRSPCQFLQPVRLPEYILIQDLFHLRLHLQHYIKAGNEGRT